MMFKNRLKDYRVMRDMTQSKLAEMIGISRSMISMYESGERRPSFEVLEAIADILNVSFNDLMGVSEHEYLYGTSEGEKKPLLGVIHCGEPILCDENIEDYVTVPEWIKCDYALRCRGDSMIDAGIEDGDVVYLRLQPEVENGEIAAVMVDGATTLKRFYRSGSAVTLVPANARMAPMVYAGDAASSVRVIGKAVGFTRIFK